MKLTRRLRPVVRHRPADEAGPGNRGPLDIFRQRSIRAGACPSNLSQTDVLEPRRSAPSSWRSSRSCTRTATPSWRSRPPTGSRRSTRWRWSARV
jgi:hypothetical protein